MAVQHANIGIVKKDLQLYYNREFSKSFRGEATTNLYGTYGVGAANAYPSAGNNWGTYRDSLYNGGAFASIGTIASVSSNIITVSSPTAYFNSFATFDVITPQTTGGGLTANTYYYFKRLSATTFTLHQYDGTEDASKTPEQVLTYINSDTRISVNATSFPTMWWGPPHVPNCALIKTAITNGFAYDNRLHDCLRLNWFRSDRSDGMAYGTTPNYIANTQYAFSAYIRASSQNAIGGTVSISAYQSGTATYPNITGAASPILTSNWQKWVGTFTSSATGGVIYFYFFPSIATLPATVDIAELQLEQKSYASEFTPTSRSANTVAGGGGLLDMSGNNVNADLTNVGFGSSGFTFNGSTQCINLGTSKTSLNISADLTVEAMIKLTSSFTYNPTIVGNGYYDEVYPYKLQFEYNTNNGNLGLFRYDGTNYRYTSWNFGSQSTYFLNKYAHVVATYNSLTNTFAIYYNGVSQTVTQVNPGTVGINNTTNFVIGAQVKTNGAVGDPFPGEINFVRVYNRGLTAEEVSQNFNATRKTYGI